MLTLGGGERGGERTQTTTNRFTHVYVQNLLSRAQIVKDRKPGFSTSTTLSSLCRCEASRENVTGELCLHVKPEHKKGDLFTFDPLLYLCKQLASSD